MNANRSTTQATHCCTHRVGLSRHDHDRRVRRAGSLRRTGNAVPLLCEQCLALVTRTARAPCMIRAATVRERSGRSIDVRTPTHRVWSFRSNGNDGRLATGKRVCPCHPVVSVSAPTLDPSIPRSLDPCSQGRAGSTRRDRRHKNSCLCSLSQRGAYAFLVIRIADPTNARCRTSMAPTLDPSIPRSLDPCRSFVASSRGRFVASFYPLIPAVCQRRRHATRCRH